MVKKSFKIGLIV